MRDSDRYREKWAVWKAAYYAGVLTVCGFFMAMAPLFEKSHSLSPMLMRFLSFYALVACGCVIWNLLLFIRLYDLLGFDRIPEREEDIESYNDKQVRILQEFAKKAPERKARDWIILGMLVGCAGSLGIALCL